MNPGPVRLLEGGHASDSERSLLRAGRSSAPVAYDVAAGAARFRNELATIAAAGAITAGAGAVRGSGVTVRGKAVLTKLAFKVVLGVMAGGVFAGAGVLAGVHMARTSVHGEAAPPKVSVLPGKTGAIAPAPPVEAPPSPVPAGPPAAAAAATPLSPMRPPIASTHAARETARRSAGMARTAASSMGNPEDRDVVDEARPAVKAEATVAPSVAPSLASARAEPPPPAAPPSPPPVEPTATRQPAGLLNEVRAVAQARELVERDPEAALDLLEKTRREHPTGYFLEERQALTVLALSRAGHSSAAREQAAAFLRAYPNGPFSDRVRAVVGP